MVCDAVNCESYYSRLKVIDEVAVKIVFYVIYQVSDEVVVISSHHAHCLGFLQHAVNPIN